MNGHSRVTSGIIIAYENNGSACYLSFLRAYITTARSHSVIHDVVKAVRGITVTDTSADSRLPTRPKEFVNRNVQARRKFTQSVAAVRKKKNFEIISALAILSNLRNTLALGHVITESLKTGSSKESVKHCS